MSDTNQRRMVGVILVVEDEALLRSLAVEALRDAQFGVLEAEHAEDALEILRTEAHGVQAVFTDVHMPGAMNGVGLAHEVHRCWPWVHLLIASGQLMPTRSELPAGCRFLSKPYHLHRVVAHMQRVLGAEERPRGAAPWTPVKG